MKIIFNGDWLDLRAPTLAESDFLLDLLTELDGLDNIAEQYMVITGFEDAADFDRRADQNTVVFIFDERQGSYSDLVRRSRAVFQAYIGDDQLVGSNHYSFPLGYSRYFQRRSAAPINDRSLNVFFIGNLHRGRIDFHAWVSGIRLPFPLRHRFQRLVGWNYDQKFPDSYIRFTNGFATGLSGQDYSKKLLDAKIVLCPGGSVSVESYRLYEALMSGCVVITTKQPARAWFEGAPIIVVGRWSDADIIVRQLLADPERMAEISEAGANWFWKTVGPKALASRIKEVLGSKKGS